MPNRSNFKTQKEYNAWYQKYRDKNRKKTREYNRKYISKWRKENNFIDNKKYHEKYPEKSAAHKLVYLAVKSGKIKKKPCMVCKSSKTVHAHHDDYFQPLKVKWFCPLHHRHYHLKKLSPGKI